MNKELRVLVVEDLPQDMALINHALRKAGLRFRSRRVESRDAFLHELERHPPDLILSDHGVPGFTGFAALAEARNRCPETPFIFVTGAPRDDSSREPLHSGADDYILKSHLNLLGPAIERALREAGGRANRSHIELALQHAEEHFRLLTQELTEHAAFLLDAGGHIATWNPGAQRLLGREPGQILGRDFASLFPGDSSKQQLPQQILDRSVSDGRTEWAVPLARGNGEIFQADAKIISLRGKAQKPRGFLCLLRGHSAAAAQPRARVAQLEAATSEMEKFTHAIATDLQLPLRDIESCSELLTKSTAGQLDQKNQSYLKTISDATSRMGRLIDDLFTFSRIGQAEMYRLSLSLREIVMEVIHDLRAETEGRDVQWVIGDLPQVMGDSVMLWQAVTSLISNALKFTRTREHARIEVGFAENAFFIRDNGIGFDPQCADRLFTVFQRLHRGEFEGTGVGLANVRRIIERHGGRVWAEGKIGEGAAFHFTLPLVS